MEVPPSKKENEKEKEKENPGITRGLIQISTALAIIFRARTAYVPGHPDSVEGCVQLIGRQKLSGVPFAAGPYS